MKPFALALMATIFAISSAQASEVQLQLDIAKLYSLERPVGSVIVANPSIADVAVHSNKELVLFGKMPGLTNLFVFDTKGKPMGSVSLRVVNSRQNMVTVYAGANRMTLSCSTVCEPTYTIGDGVDGLRVQGTDVASQATKRFDMATSAAGGSASSSQTSASDGEIEFDEGPDS